MSTTNGHVKFPADARRAVPLYVRHGLGIVPVPSRSKDPGFNDWPAFRFDLSELDYHFPPEVEKNIAVLNGAVSDREADVDLDCEEARTAAPLLLPSAARRGRLTSRRPAPRTEPAAP